MSSENETDKQPLPPESAEQPASPEAPKAEEAPKAAEAPKADAAEAPAEKPAKPAPVAAAAGGAEAPKKAPPPKKEPEAPPPPPEPGKYGQLLIANGFHPVALGNASNGTEMIELKADELVNGCRLLRDNDAAQFDLLVSVSAVDWKDRLEAVYHLYSTKTFDKVAVKATAVDEKLPSVVPVWQGADWHEREAYDLFGIIFEGHPKLERILMPVDWIGHPMRKDYTVSDPRLVWNER